MSSKVSVVVCCYNGVKYISSCFQCLLSQTYKNIEVLFVDDGSKDHSFEAALAWSSQFESQGMTLCCLQQVNQGAGFAAQTALLHATGDFIMCFDIDDFLFPSSIEKQVSFLDAHSSFDVVRTNGYEVQTNQNKALFVVDYQEKNAEDIFSLLVLGKTNNWAGSYMVRANKLWSVFPDHRIIGSRYGQNLQILLSAAYRSKSGFIDEPLMKYLRRDDSFTKSNQSFARTYQLYQEFENIRIDLLNHLHLPKDDSIWAALTVYYASLRKNLCVEYHCVESFMKEFYILKSYNCLTYLDYYYYHFFRDEKIRAYCYRILHRIVS